MNATVPLMLTYQIWAKSEPKENKREPVRINLGSNSSYAYYVLHIVDVQWPETVIRLFHLYRNNLLYIPIALKTCSIACEKYPLF